MLDKSTVEEFSRHSAAELGKQTKGTFGEFRAFILRGNVVDLAVGIIIGAAFTSVVSALVTDLITPLIGIPGDFNFPNLAFSVNKSTFLIGHFINSIISFLIVALVVFFFVVKPTNALIHLYYPRENTRECPFCINKISIKATRCGFCTSELQPVNIEEKHERHFKKA